MDINITITLHIEQIYFPLILHPSSPITATVFPWKTMPTVTSCLVLLETLKLYFLLVIWVNAFRRQGGRVFVARGAEGSKGGFKADHWGLAMT